MARAFIYNGAALEDPDPVMKPDDVRKQYAAVYPALTNAGIVGPKTTPDGEVYEFKVSAGTKG